MRRAVPCLSVLLLAWVAAGVPPAGAHGLVNAGELETLVVQDEASDLVTGAGLGFDLVQLYVGEAHLPGVGDGLYVHTVLYGGPGGRPAIDGPLSVRFEFGFGDRTVERTVQRLDDGSYQGDFDQLVAVEGDGEVELQRAFLAYPDGIGPGSVLTSLRATSLVGQEARDVAPGGVVLPGAQAEVPMGESSQVVDAYTLLGPAGYLDRVEVVPLAHAADTFLVTAWTGLRQGSQHILLAAEPRDGWATLVDGAGGDTAPGGHQAFEVRLQPGNGTYGFDVLTDLGGHVRLTAQQGADGLRVTGGLADALQPAPTTRESPLPPALALAGLAAALVLGRKAQA